jgi:hypothetical protein
MSAPASRTMERLEDLPNVGSSTVVKLRLIGVHHPKDLEGIDPYGLYEELNTLTGQRHDPCLLDVFISAVRFMDGAPPLPWWAYTAERKATLSLVTN